MRYRIYLSLICGLMVILVMVSCSKMNPEESATAAAEQITQNYAKSVLSKSDIGTVTRHWDRHHILEVAIWLGWRAGFMKNEPWYKLVPSIMRDEVCHRGRATASCKDRVFRHREI